MGLADGDSALANALQQTKIAEGWTDTQVGALCGVSQTAAYNWARAIRRMPGYAVVILQRTSKTFRDLTLGDLASGELKAA